MRLMAVRPRKLAVPCKVLYVLVNPVLPCRVFTLLNPTSFPKPSTVATPAPSPLFQKDVIPKHLRGGVCKSCDSKALTERERSARWIAANPAFAFLPLYFVRNSNWLYGLRTLSVTYG